MSHTTLLDAAPEPATAAPPERRIRCRRLVTIQHHGRSTGAHLGPPSREQCTAEVADPDGASKLCVEHLADAMTDLAAAGAVVILADLPDRLREQIGRWQLAQEVVEERIADGRLVRLPSGGLIEADQYDPAVHGERAEAGR